MRLWPVLLLLPAIGRAQLQPVEFRGLIESLYLGNYSDDDLKTARRSPGVQAFSMPLVNLGLDDPMEAVNRLMTLHQNAHGSLAQQIRAACTEGYGDPFDLKTTVPAPLAVPDTVPEAVRPQVAQLAGDIEEANATIHEALSKLSADEQRDVIESLPRWAAPTPGFVPDFAKRPQISQKALMALMARVDLAAIRRTARKLAMGVETELPELKKNAAAITTPIRFEAHGVVVELSNGGEHESLDTNLCICFGGDNHYTGRYGAGVGYASVLIDLGRRETTDGPDASIGAGVLGIGLAYFAGEGDCDFKGGSLSFGVGLAGVGGLSKHGGNDRYRAGSLAEGAAAFGVGILLDSGGDDHFTATTGAQGYARTGGFGWLIAQSGDDVYRTDSGQGCGTGVKTADGIIAGGVGLLTDLGGDDIYIGGKRCQACGTAGGLGSLYDAQGRDTYSAMDEAQASADTQASAYFFDLEGDDSYALHGGVGQSTAVGRSVALFLDRAGNDLYSSLDTHPGTALDGSLAIFLDGEGNDRYQGDVMVGFPTRGPASIGLFADLGGSDGYGSAENFEGQATVQPGKKIAYDAQTPQDTLSVTSLPLNKTPKPGSVPLLSPPQMADLYRQACANTGFNEATNSFVAMGQPAFDWLLANQLDSDSENRNRPFLALATALGKPAEVKLASRIADSQDATALGALGICVEGGYDVAAPLLDAAIDRPALRRSAVEAAGRLGTKSLVGKIVPLISSSDPLIVYEALNALAKLRSQEGLNAARGDLTASDSVIRDVATRYVALFPTQSEAFARTLLENSDERTQRCGIEILSRTGTGEALNLIAPYLSKGNVGVKIEALLALDGRCPTEARTAYLALRDDANALVKSIAQRTDPGR